MNRVYLHEKQKLSLEKMILIFLIPLFLYGFFRNGIKLYRFGFGFINLFKPIIFLIFSIGISFLYKKIFKEDDNYLLLTNIIISLVTLPNTNIFIYLILLIMSNIIYHYIKINNICVYMILLIIYSMIFKNLSYVNIYEVNHTYYYNFIDYLFGKGSGGIGNTFIIFSLISLFYLSTLIEYKKNLVYSAFMTYYLLLFIYAFIIGNFDLNLFVNSNLIFAFIFIAPLSKFSPYSSGGCLIYGILLGFFTFLLIFIDLNSYIYFVLLILNILSKYLDNFITKNVKKCQN